MAQYFENDESLKHQDIEISFEILNEKFTFQSDIGVFSKDVLDDGTRLLLETIAKVDLGSKILDLGCGVGPIGLLLAHFDSSREVTLVDVNLRALECAKENAKRLSLQSRTTIKESNVYSSLLNESFDSIVTNPPIRAGKKVTYAMYAGAISHLNKGGKLILVIRKQQGAESCTRYLETLFTKVTKVATKKGYRVIIATK